MKPTDIRVLAFGDRAWGKGADAPTAIANMVKNGGSRKHYVLYIVHKDTTVDQMGYMNYPKGAFDPIQIDAKGVGKAKL